MSGGAERQHHHAIYLTDAHERSRSRRARSEVDRVLRWAICRVGGTLARAGFEEWRPPRAASARGGCAARRRDRVRGPGQIPPPTSAGRAHYYDSPCVAAAEPGRPQWPDRRKGEAHPELSFERTFCAVRGSLTKNGASGLIRAVSHVLVPAAGPSMTSNSRRPMTTAPLCDVARSRIRCRPRPFRHPRVELGASPSPCCSSAPARSRTVQRHCDIAMTFDIAVSSRRRSVVQTARDRRLIAAEQTCRRG